MLRELDSRLVPCWRVVASERVKLGASRLHASTAWSVQAVGRPSVETEQTTGSDAHRTPEAHVVGRCHEELAGLAVAVLPLDVFLSHV